MGQALQDRVAIVTGAGGGLGRTHALELARHGARVIVNDIGGAADAVTEEIRRRGGLAVAFPGDVTRTDEMQAMAARVAADFGRIDILVNNAGILRDRSFAKMTEAEFRQVFEVHVMGAFHCTKAVWAPMRAHGHGRIIMTTSSSGLYGNFGQANYGAAKMALVGLMQTLALEGAKHDIRVNCLPPDALARLTPAQVSLGLLALVGPDAPTRMILLAGAGSFECAHVTMTEGIHCADPATAAGEVRRRLGEVADRRGEQVPQAGWDPYRHELRKAEDRQAPARAGAGAAA